MSTSFTRTRKQLADMVLRKLGILGAGGADVSADLDVVFEATDLRLKEMHRRGIFWRKVDTVPKDFSASAGTISAHVGSSDILFPISMVIVDGSTDQPVDIIGIREYAMIENKREAGLPTKALWRGSDEFFFWPVPTAATTAKLTYERITDDTSHGAAPDVEVSMLRWLKDLIAYDVGDDYGMTEGKMGRFMKEAQMAEQNIRALNAEHKSYSTVSVDDFEIRSSRRETDYGL